jgi:transcriptional regulator of acetoin/glycerol metabolism
MKRPDVYHADVVFSVLSDHVSAAKSSVAASWSRSVTQFGLDPECNQPPHRLGQTEFNAAYEEIAPLVRLAQDTLDRLFHSVGDAGCCVLLSDRNGVPLDRRGKVGDDQEFRNLGLWTGMVWSEASEGTNGVGTSLTEGRPLTIHRDQHFMTRNIGLSCTVAPIRDEHGNIAAALDVSNARADLTPAIMNLVAAATCDAAQKIEARYFREVFSNARIVLGPDTVRGPGGLLAVNRDDLVIGASYMARRAYGLTDETLAHSFSVNDILAPEKGGAVDDLVAAERGAVQRALSRAHGNVSAAARLLGVSRATLHRKIARFGLHR